MRLRHLFLSLAFVLPFSGSGSAQAVSPCLSATSACTEWVTLGGGPSRAMVYRTFALGLRNPNVHRALIMVHGTLRNADHYFVTATGAGYFGGALEDTIILSPAFHSADRGCNDKLEPHEVSWSCHGDSWRSGGTATSDKNLTSFDFMDELLRKLADKRVFPNLKNIVVAGHSAGGQFVARYEMANRVDEGLGVPVTYVVANPSSYAWPVSDRPLPVDDGLPANEVAAWNSEKPHTQFSYGPFDPTATKANDYDTWPYGLKGRTGGYTVKMSDEQLRKQLASRHTIYLLSQVDTLPLGGFDGSPGAMAQGVTRRGRGEAFVEYLDDKMGSKNKAVIVPECGHNDRCVYTADEVLPLIFPK